MSGAPLASASAPADAARPGKRALLALTFLQSFAGILLARGVYFYTHDRLAWDATDNLLLGLGYGATYVAGARLSHALAARTGEKRLLTSLLVALVLAHAVVFLVPRSGVLAGALPVISFLLGVKWPVVESYMSAGETPATLLRMSARYNVTWASSVPLGLGVSGSLIASPRPELLFLVPGVLGAVALGLSSATFPPHPAHLDAGHPERPSPGTLARYAALTVSARWTMMLSYLLIYLLAPLMPDLLQGLGLDVARSTPAAALLDLGRLIAFLGVAAYAGWQLRAAPLAVAALALPASLALVLFTDHLPVALAGELLLGLAAGFSYYAALYYALVVKNASVDAGGAHEALIGLGYALGPITGLAAGAVTSWLGTSRATGTLVTAAPVVLACVACALRPLLAARARGAP